MGPDAGGADAILHEHSFSAADVLWLEGYHDLKDLAAVTAVSDCVALPYSLSSQSAAASLAKAYRTTVLAYSTGGLVEQADELVDSLDVETWSTAISKLSRQSAKQSVIPSDGIAPIIGPVPSKLRHSIRLFWNA